MNLPNPFKLLWLQFRSEWRLYARDRGAMFWTCPDSCSWILSCLRSTAAMYYAGCVPTAGR